MISGFICLRFFLAMICFHRIVGVYMMALFDTLAGYTIGPTIARLMYSWQEAINRRTASYIVYSDSLHIFYLHRWLKICGPVHVDELRRDSADICWKLRRQRDEVSGVSCNDQERSCSRRVYERRAIFPTFGKSRDDSQDYEYISQQLVG